MKKYRVEAFIIPSNNKSGNDSNQIDDEKLAIKLQNDSLTSLDELNAKETTNEKEEEKSNECVNICNNLENDNQCSSEFSGVFFEIDEHIYDEIITPKKSINFNRNEVKIQHTEYVKATFKIEEPIYDEPFIGNLSSINASKSNSTYDIPQSHWTLGHSKYRRFGVVAPKLPKRSTSLKSIVEGNESFDETLQEICSHGRKNGCSLKNQRPEDISQEIFKENWMQRLESLRKLETLLKDKEVALQSRERLLFKKEKELRILERLVKDKMKQAELYAKRYKKSLSSESISNNERNIESRTSDDSKGHAKSEDSSGSMNSLPRINSNIIFEREEIPYKNPPNSRSSLLTDRLSSRISSVRSKSKPRQKIRYDDLDSTLSADIGDSSFIVTSRKFDPEVFKKPAAFSRSASERRPRVEQLPSTRLSSLREKDEPIEKTLKRISENIIASQEQTTKFLNYGLIDEKSSANVENVSKGEPNNQKRFSYLNLETVNKTIHPNVASKERPISWSEDADDWLKKKRQAYNATKQSINDNIADKENFDRQIQANKSMKVNKKKENNRKKFSIFR